MKLSKMASVGGQLAEKFRGCLVGALVGDVLGAPFEDEYSEEAVSKSVLTNYIKKFLTTSPDAKGQLPFQPYTDDTVMSWNIAQSLINNQGFNAIDMAKRFVKDYFHQSSLRGYGGHVGNVFEMLRATGYSDVFDPATQQFNGAGSYGNGGAMRVAPIALFYYKSEQLIEMAKNSALITHAHRDGYNGAILQCLAVHQALKSDPSSDLNIGQFLDNLISSMEALEPEDDTGRTGVNAVAKEPWSVVGYHALKEMNCPKNLIGASYDLRPYCTKLKILMHLLTRSKKDLTPREAFEVFGHGVAAADSVPIAIYSFLRAQKPSPDFKTDNPFVRALYLSIASGGDTDTIATMACAISGAYHGLSSIPEGLTRKCEQIDECRKLADELFAAAMKE